MKKILISIVTYKNHNVTKECLRSLEHITHSDLVITTVVINNDTEKEFIYSWKGAGDFIILNEKSNMGFSGGHNIGIKQGISESADYIVILNNDTEIRKDFLVTLIEDAEKHPDAGVFVPKIYFAKGSEYHNERYRENERGKVIWYAGGSIDWKNLILSHRGVDEVDTGQYDTAGETDFASGCCMVIRREVIEKIGMFDERYFLYYEDSDLNERIKRAGYTVRYVPNAVLWHKNAGSTGGSGSGLQDYYISRNRLLFGFRYAPLRTRVALIRESMRLMRSGRTWQKKGISDFFVGKFGKGSYRV